MWGLGLRVPGVETTGIVHPRTNREGSRDSGSFFATDRDLPRHATTFHRLTLALDPNPMNPLASSPSYY